VKLLPFALLCAFVALISAPARGQIRYVDANLTTGLDNGTSWANAYRGPLGLFRAGAWPGTTVWVADGVYRSQTIVAPADPELDTAATILGGFAGGETSASQRDPVANPTIITGDINGDDAQGLYADNTSILVYHNGSGLGAPLTLDGFTFTGANQHALLMEGGASLYLSQCTLRANRGPAVVWLKYTTAGGGSSGGFGRVRFEDNSATPILSEVSVADLALCTFVRNSSPIPGLSSGGIFVTGNLPASILIARSCVFFGNSGGEAGAVAGPTNAAIHLVDCTIVSNTTLVQQGAVRSADFVRNSIVYGNTGPGGSQTLLDQVSGGLIENSCVQGLAPGQGNLGDDPRFVDAPGGNLALDPFSPCVDAGKVFPASLSIDITGQPRPVDDPVTRNLSGSTIDMGAHEFRPGVSRPFCSGDAQPTQHTTLCPCGNFGTVGRGCANSVEPLGAVLSATGTPALDDVVLESNGAPGTAFTLFLQHDAFADRVVHDGVLCADGFMTRLCGRAALGGQALFPNSAFANDATRTLSQRGGVTVGSGAVRYYSAWYRNASSTFCPPATANVTNGWMLQW